jgi:putative tricarboxylic transport membrane protein
LRNTSLRLIEIGVDYIIVIIVKQEQIGGRKKMRGKMFLSLLILMGVIVSFQPDYADADDYPNKSIRCIIAQTAGGGTDVSARIMQPFIEKKLGVSVIMENRPGAGTEIGHNVLFNAKPDGYTIGFGGFSEYMSVHIFQTPTFKYDDIIPLVVAYVDPRILIVNKDSALNSIKDFVEEVKRNPGKITIAVSNLSGQHLEALLLKRALNDKGLNLDFKIVPFTGGSLTATALLGGHASSAWGDVFSRINVREQTKCIAISAREAHPLWPEGQPINNQLKEFGVEINFFPKYEPVWVRAEFKKAFPNRYAKLQNVFLEISQDKEFMELEKKLKLNWIRLWKKGEELTEDFNKQTAFLRTNKDILQEK